MLLLIGMLIGLLLGLTGAGGSVFAVPLLVLLVGLPMNQAVGIALGAVAASAIYGSLRNSRTGTILWMPALVLASTGALTAPAGKWLSTLIPESVLLIGFCLLAALIAGRMWISAVQNPTNTTIVRAAPFRPQEPLPPLCRLSKTGQFQLGFRCLSGLALGGLLTGFLSGLFGVGGGFLIVPLILYLSQVTMTQAVSSSLVIISLVSTSGFVSYLLLNHHTGLAIQWNILGWICSGGLAGMFAGQYLSHFIAGPRLQQLFAISLMGISLITLFYHH